MIDTWMARCPTLGDGVGRGVGVWEVGGGEGVLHFMIWGLFLEMPRKLFGPAKPF